MNFEVLWFEDKNFVTFEEEKISAKSLRFRRVKSKQPTFSIVLAKLLIIEAYKLTIKSTEGNK